MTMSKFIEEAIRGTKYMSAIWSIPGFDLSYIKPDYMHTVCLGILLYYIGNVMWELFGDLGGTFTTWQDACVRQKMFAP